jgi:hypothetical protein
VWLAVLNVECAAAAVGASIMIRAAFLCFMVVASFCFFQLQSIAQQKHSCDMLNESRLRINSKLCEQNYKTADKNALFNIGYLFQTGLNNAEYEGDKLIKLGEKDTETAILWYQRATELGDDGSPYIIANLYLNGYDGITRNYEKSIYWFRVAVSLKNPSAANELARIYGKGFGSIPQLQNDYLQYYWVLVSDAIDKKPDYQWNKQIEARLAYKDIIEVQNKVEFCVKSNFKNCNP